MLKSKAKGYYFELNEIDNEITGVIRIGMFILCDGVYLGFDKSPGYGPPIKKNNTDSSNKNNRKSNSVHTNKLPKCILFWFTNDYYCDFVFDKTLNLMMIITQSIHKIGQQTLIKSIKSGFHYYFDYIP